MKYIFFCFAILCIYCCYVLPTFVGAFELYSDSFIDSNSRVPQNPWQYTEDILRCWEGPKYDCATLPLGCMKGILSAPYAFKFKYTFWLNLGTSLALCSYLCGVTFRRLTKKKKVFFKVKFVNK